jgi:hypothetical protein
MAAPAATYRVLTPAADPVEGFKLRQGETALTKVPI